MCSRASLCLVCLQRAACGPHGHAVWVPVRRGATAQLQHYDRMRRPPASRTYAGGTSKTVPCLSQLCLHAAMLSLQFMLSLSSCQAATPATTARPHLVTELDLLPSGLVLRLAAVRGCAVLAAVLSCPLEPVRRPVRVPCHGCCIFPYAQRYRAVV